MTGMENEQTKNGQEQEVMETAAEENAETVDPKEENAEDSRTEDAFSEEGGSGDFAESAEEDMKEPSQEKESADGQDSGTAEEKDGEDPQDKKEKKRHFAKGEKKEDRLKEQLNELNDRVVRQMAEFENYRKRTEKEKQAMFETGARSVIEKLLPVVDNFERGLAVLEEGEERTPFEKGVLMTYKQLMTELEKLEVRPLDAVGKEFDPNLHNAVMHVDDESLGENIVVEEMQKGYTYRDSVVRYSMVKVAN